MTSPELEDEAIRIIREVEPNWPSTTCRWSSRTGNDHDPSARNKYARQLVHLCVEIRLVEVPRVLLVHVPAICRAYAHQRDG